MMIPVLMYHQIAELSKERDPLCLAVTPEMFAAQMEYLSKNNYQCLTLEQVVAATQNDLVRPKKAVALTFDDGFRDLYTTVRPILNRFGFSATIFFTAGRAGQHSDWAGQHGLQAAKLLSWLEAQELAKDCFAFESHTLSHPRLTTLDDEQVRAELLRSKELIEEKLNHGVRFFSFPYSDHDHRIRRLVAASGYAAAFGGDRQNLGPFNLWRVQCDGHDNLTTFAFKATGWHNRLIWMREQHPVGKTLCRFGRGIKRHLNLAHKIPRPETRGRG